jgi:hypothetical protein
MNLFLRAKHWQIFTLIFGSIILSDLVIVFSAFFNLLYLATYFGWIYSLAIEMQKMVSATVKMKVIPFKIFFFIPTIYIVLILVVTEFFSKSFGDPFFGPYGAIVWPVHLISMFCMLYCFYFVAKTIKTVELQSAVTFGDFFLEFLLVWFFPIGLWILQPRINKLIELNANSSEDVVTE